MAPRTLDFKCAVITGGAGGIGRAMADWLIDQGKEVIIVGRTESKLQTAAKEMGGRATYYVLDTGNISAIPEFVARIVRDHPEVDCLINNAGVQRPLDINNLDLAKADEEININIRGPMHLASAFLPHFKTRPAGAVIMNVSSVLGFVPISIVNPVYNGTKAWLHFYTMTQRTQLAKAGANIKVVEIAPPTVATDLHRERADPDDNKKEKNPNALSVEEFMEFVVRGWREDKDMIGAGSSEKVVDRWYKEFGPDYEKASGGV
ncbi:MAG: ribonuclease T2-like [Chaenotheca gracillima]|nr:MAG: ribonuclease T2-like [Chaenotheca gracillima]